MDLLPAFHSEGDEDKPLQRRCWKCQLVYPDNVAEDNEEARFKLNLLTAQFTNPIAGLLTDLNRIVGTLGKFASFRLIPAEVGLGLKASLYRLRESTAALLRQLEAADVRLVGARRLDNPAMQLSYPALGAWCRTRRGQTIVCEEVGADWLPFRHFGTFKANESRTGGKRCAEAIWLSDEHPAHTPPAGPPRPAWPTA